MILSEIPSPNTERDTQLPPDVKQETLYQPEPVFVPTPKDHLVVAIVSLVMLIFLAGLTFGSTRVLHTGLIGWLAILTVIFSALITINGVIFLSNSHLKRIDEQPKL